MGENDDMGIEDLGGAKLPELDWSDPDQALASVFEYSKDHAREAEDWYTEKRRSKKIGGQVLRVMSITLGAVAAIIPILSQIFADSGGPAIPPAWSSVALVFAAALIGFDRYFGLSTGWTRFMTANQRISQLRRNFEFSWQEIVADRPNSTVGRLRLAQQFVGAVDNEVARETGAWSSEFQSSLDAQSAQIRNAGA